VTRAATAAAVLLLAWPAAADRLGIAATTSVPLDLGVRLTAEVTPARLRLSTGAGFLPGAYVDGINALVQAAGGYGDATAELVRSSLQSSFVWRSHVGLRPLGDFYVEAGYGLVSLGGGASTAELLSALAGRSFPGASRTSTFTARSTLHLLDAEAGWEGELAEDLRLRAALGAVFTFAASTHVEPDFEPRLLARPAVAAFARRAEIELDRTYERYVHMPVVTIALDLDAL
jgi:hypothetical protein